MIPEEKIAEIREKVNQEGLDKNMSISEVSELMIKTLWKEAQKELLQNLIKDIEFNNVSEELDNIKTHFQIMLNELDNK